MDEAREPMETNKAYVKKKTTFHTISVTYRKLNRIKVDKINAQVQNRKSNSEKK